MGASTGLVTRTVGLRASMVARVGRAQLHAQYSWMCHGVWPGKNSWYWMAREQAWPPTEHSSSDPAPFVTTQADIVPSVASGGNVNVMLSTLEESSSQVLDPTYQSSVASQ